MKIRIQKVLALAGLSLLLFASCSKDGDTPGPDKKGENVSAVIDFESGKKIDFSFESDGFALPLVVGPSEDGLYGIMMPLMATIDGEEYTINITAFVTGEGTFNFKEEPGDEDPTAIITLTKGSDSAEPTVYLPVKYSEEDDAIGTSVLTITSLTENRIKGSFSAELFSQTEKANITKGKFDIGIIRSTQYE